MGALYGILGAADPGELRAAGDRLAHRGREAVEWSPGRDVHLGIRGARRIVDLQEHGPIAFEGAIDNRGDIARLLRRRGAENAGPAEDAGLVFELVDSFGIQSLEQLAGQFALALWHGPERRLLLARDRTGYAPLYFTIAGDRFAFASEYKALLVLAGVAARPDLDALQVAHATEWSSPGLTCLEGIFPVAPGSCIEARVGRISSLRYWYGDVGAATGREVDHASRVRDSLLAAMGRQVSGYGRVGVWLGGGLDSALVAAGARRVAEDREIHTFSAGRGPDDRTLARTAAMAKAVGARHHAVLVEPDDLHSLLPWMVWHLEEPVGGEEAAGLFAAAREAARHVTLVLMGCGLDGLLGGLPRHRVADLAFRHSWLRGPLGEVYDQVHRGVPPASLAGRALGTAYHRGREVTAARLRGARALEPLAGFPRGEDPQLSELLRRDLMGLPHQSSFERLFAGLGLRAAAPHMDPRLVEAALSVPDRLKIGRGIRKPILRKICEGMLSPALVSGRPRGPAAAHDLRMSDALDRLAVELLSPGAVRERGLVEPVYVAGLLRRPRGRPYGPDRVRRIWSLLLTELWARCFLDRAGAAPEHPPPAVRTLEGAPSRGTASGSRAAVPDATGRTAG
ncbi:MAG: hypothetical protein H0X69_06900 [Gemmatimonadales bacterium]|nr:hypothetical protein [Gemmatimonadales bacterium]